MSCAFCCWVDAIQARAELWPCCLQFVVEEVLGAHGMINYVDARTSWMDDIVKQAQWQGITQVSCPFLLPISRHNIHRHCMAWSTMWSLALHGWTTL
jgi:hypothetical protein